MNTFFTADTHFGHGNIIKYCNRPFTSAKEHDEALIANWNSMVNKNDHVYHLGDFAFGSPQWCRSIRDKLNGKIFLIEGNHDKALRKAIYSDGFEWVKDLHFYKSQFKGQKIEIVLCHYAMRVWPKSFHGSWHLYGHSHGSLPEETDRFSFDVGVDCWNYFPVPIEKIVEKMEAKRPNFVESKSNRGKNEDI